MDREEVRMNNGESLQLQAATTTQCGILKRTAIKWKVSWYVTFKWCFNLVNPNEPKKTLTWPFKITCDTFISMEPHLRILHSVVMCCYLLVGNSFQAKTSAQMLMMHLHNLVQFYP